MKKMLTLLLTLIMILSLIPISAMADTKFPTKPTLNPSLIEDPPKKLPNEIRDKIIEDKLADKVSKLPQQEEVIYHPDGKHEYGYDCNTKYHWLQCPCGCKISMERHVDPKDTSDDTCICGYHFSDNADLVTLWVRGCPGIKYFDKKKTEYTLNAYTYKDIKEIKISTRTHDSEATVELPEDLTLKEGENKFEVKVHAENQKVTKVYTLIINKEAKK